MKCIDCGKPVSKKIYKRCVTCCNKRSKGANHTGWKGGLAHCYECKKVLTHYIHGTKCRPCAFKGAGNPAWKGGRQITPNGYIYIYAPEHPSRIGKRNKNVFQHRLVMEQKLGRYLTKTEIVHHLNGVRNDNRPENLVVVDRNNHEHYTLLILARKRILELE